MASINIIVAFVLSALLTTNAWSQECEPMFEDASFGVGSYSVSGNLVLMTRPMIGIDVFDASDPNDFVFLSQIPFLGAIDLEIPSAGDVAGVKVSEGAIQLVDLSDPLNPVMGAIVTNPFGLISSFGIYNSTLYTNRNGFVRAYSLADIQNPVEVASANSNIQAKGLAIGADVLITKSTNGGGTVYVFDLSDPNTLTLSAQVSGTLPSLNGSELAVIDGGLIRLYDLQNPSAPVELGSFSHGHNNGFSSIEGLALIGDLIAILSDEDMAYYPQITVMDVQTPLTPSLLYVEQVVNENRGPASTNVSMLGNLMLFQDYQSGQFFLYTDFASSLQTQAVYEPVFWGSPIEHDGYIYGSHDGTLLVAEAGPLRTLQPVSTLELEASGSASLASLRLIGVIDDQLVAISSEAFSPWEQYLHSVDVSDPLNPVITERVWIAKRGGINDPILVGDKIYAIEGSYPNNFTAAIHVITLESSGEFAPVSTTTIPSVTQSHKMVYANNLLYVSQRFGFGDPHDFRIFGLQDPLVPQLIGTLDHDDQNISTDFLVSGDYAYFKTGARSLRIMDVSNPAAPFATPYRAHSLPSTAIIQGKKDDILYLRENVYPFEDPFLLHTLDVSHLDLLDSFESYSIDLGGRSTNWHLASFTDTHIDFTSGSQLGGNGTARFDISACASPACPADINDDGVLNFLDISAFLSAYGSADLIADINGDGNLNFLDVSALLSAFAVGCP